MGILGIERRGVGDSKGGMSSRAVTRLCFSDALASDTILILYSVNIHIASFLVAGLQQVACEGIDTRVAVQRISLWNEIYVLSV